jgi:hypothetical protein
MRLHEEMFVQLDDKPRLARRGPRLGSRVMIALLSPLLVGAFGCGSKARDDPPIARYAFSFENDMEAWSPRALDVTVAVGDSTGEIPWHIQRTNARASSGSIALEYYFFNQTDAAKIWIERDFLLQPGHNYDYELSFDFWAPGSPFTGSPLFAGMVAESPRSRAEIVSQVIGGTGSGGVGRWTTHAARGTVQADSTGIVHAIVGVWGTFEIAFTYDLDNVHLLLWDRTGVAPAPGAEVFAAPSACRSLRNRRSPDRRL